MKRLTHIWQALVSLSLLTILGAFILLIVIVLAEMVSDYLRTKDGGVSVFALLLLAIALFLLVGIMLPAAGALLRSLAGIFDGRQVKTEKEDDSPNAFGALTWLIIVVLFGGLMWAVVNSPGQSPFTLEMLPSLCFAAFPLAMIILGIDYIGRWVTGLFR